MFPNLSSISNRAAVAALAALAAVVAAVVERLYIPLVCSRRKMADDTVTDSDARYGAMVEFLACFPTISGTPPSSIEELGDGVALFEALSEM